MAESGWTVCIGPASAPELLPARQLHAETYDRLGYLTDDQHLDEHGTVEDSWTPYSTHVGLFRDGHVVGHLRLVGRNEAGQLPMNTYVADVAPPDNAVEVSALVVDATGRAALKPAEMLYQSAFFHLVEQGIDYMTAILERPLLRILSRTFKYPVNVLAEDIPYAHTTNYAMSIYLPECFELWKQGKLGPRPEYETHESLSA